MTRRLKATRFVDIIGQTIHVGDVVMPVDSNSYSGSRVLVTKETPERIQVGNRTFVTPERTLVITSNLIALGQEKTIDDLFDKHKGALDYSDVVKKQIPQRYVIRVVTDNKDPMKPTPIGVIIITCEGATRAARSNALSSTERNLTPQGLRMDSSVVTLEESYVQLPFTCATQQTTFWKNYSFDYKLSTLTAKFLNENGLSFMPTDEVITFDAFNASASPQLQIKVK